MLFINDIYLTILVTITTVSALECMQCDKNAAWYSEEEHERHIELCQNGLIPSTPCRNNSHTHCIVSWYRSGDSKEKIITERKCGGLEDITGCTLYNSKINRKIRHLLSVEHNNGATHRTTSALFVEVCSESCPDGKCSNVSAMKWAINVAIISVVSLLQK
ncbi:unnamed protein product [Cylicocyclus nassatus]|uniref:Uncharacterized protein n=1 Tax=Cylicocyclus nassatus TaxID=53992 RepID=A0AA36GMN6_CYLNA|nr:unnamed protein product [Cylicocyclus nassatus]